MALLAWLRSTVRALLLRLCAALANAAVALPAASSQEASETRRQVAEVRQMLSGAEARCHEGISTTDIVGRLLLLTQDHHTNLLEESATSSAGVFASQQSSFLVTSQLLRAFSGALPGHKGGQVVYVDGAWDMFHCGHVDLLRKAKNLGDLLIVGVHADAVVNKHRGSNYPIMNMQERTLSLAVIAQRLQQRRQEVAERQKSKVSQEEAWYRQKHGLV
eukprot:g24081.t1